MATQPKPSTGGYRPHGGKLGAPPLSGTAVRRSTGEQIDAIAKRLSTIAFRAQYGPHSTRLSEAMIDEVEVAALDLRAIVRGRG